MKPKLSPREEDIINAIKNHIRINGYPPSVREIGQAVKLSSSSTVHSYLRRLEKKGLIRRDPTKPRALEILHTDKDTDLAPELPEFNIVPILGRVAAGEPVLAVENYDETFPLPLNFTGPGEFFLLTVKGDSMIEAGILENDLVLVRRQSTAQNSDIVVALLEDEATVKRFYLESEHVRLQPENSLLKPIYTREVTILGKVVGLIRKL
ncbi:MAG: transcriptional repressor LexA [Bacillota bacterium]